MSNTILGIDLGTNSIGWAIRDKYETGNQIISNGVLTFDKGVGEEKGIEFPKVKKRTESRGKRRNYQAEKYRKWELLEVLIKHNMCPLSIEELNEWRKYRKDKKRKYPQTEEFINWLRFDFNGDGKPDFHLFGGDKHENHYLFRAKSINENPEDKAIFEKNPQILGRIFYHLVQRRGFKGRDEEEAKTMIEGSKKNGTPGRKEIAGFIEEYNTLGAALYYFQKEKSKKHTKVRIRQRYNLRKDYDYELREICRVHNLGEKFYEKLRKAIIWQRPLRTQKGLVGLCTYEKNKRRAPVSHPLYEEYRTWVFINNLKIEVPEGWEHEKYLKDKIYPLFYKSGNDFKLSSILDQLKKDNAEINSRFGKREKTKVLSAKFLKQLEDILGENWKENYEWEDIFNREAQSQKKEKKGTYTVEDIWHVLFTFDSLEKLKEFAENKLNLSKKKATKFSKIRLQQGYATLSLSAIKKILPYLQKGFLYSKAVYMANLQKVLGTNDITEEFVNHFSEEIDFIFKKNKLEKQLNNVINSLIRNELIAGDYVLENNRKLDESELSLINEKLIEVIGEISWQEFSTKEQQDSINYTSSQFREFLKKPLKGRKGSFLEQPRLHQQIFDYLQETYEVSDKNIKYLWHPSEQEKYPNAEEFHEVSLQGNTLYIKEKELERFLHKNPKAEAEGVSLKLLGNPEPISKGFKNPMALKTLHKLKHLLNYLLQTEQIDEHTRIVVEIARELNNANYRKALEKWQNQRERENEIYKNTIEEINKECDTNFETKNKTLIRKIRLWEEQKKQCMYTGRTINKCDLLNGEHFDIEHTIPASISFDNELKNLTIADKDFNSNVKGKKFPAQLNNYRNFSTDNGETLQPIIKNIEAIFGKRSVEKRKAKGKGQKKEIEIVRWEKITNLETQLDDWLKNTKYASTKERKDYCIQQRHLIKFELDYLKRKLQTFTIEEYKVGWRNSQLRDTQIMTKYAVPYLKTVFNRVEVQKGIITDNFKEIYKVKLPFEKKDRSKHSHHAIDAAILTLIPKPAYRDEILKKYNHEKDNRTGKTYHENPMGWKDFKTSYILGIEDKTLINNIKDHRTLTPTFKRLRKRGKIERKEDGSAKWAKGDTIRGQLHGESFYGAVKQPKRDDENKILFDENGKMKLEDEIKLVIRKPLLFKKDASSPGFKSLKEIKKCIVDKVLFEIIKKQVQNEENKNGNFKSALGKGIWMLNKSGERVNKIRHIRCFDRLSHTAAVQPHKHDFLSEKEYKHTTYAQNGENVFCLFYKREIKGKEEKAIKIVGIFDLAEMNISDKKEFFKIPLFNSIEKKKKQLSLYSILQSGQKAIFYKESLEELKELLQKELSDRLYKMYQFESDTSRIKFKHHLISGSNTDIKKQYKESSLMNYKEYTPLLRLTAKEWNFAIEDKDFRMNLDGSIEFKF